MIEDEILKLAKSYNFSKFVPGRTLERGFGGSRSVIAGLIENIRDGLITSPENVSKYIRAIRESYNFMNRCYNQIQFQQLDPTHELFKPLFETRDQLQSLGFAIFSLIETIQRESVDSSSTKHLCERVITITERMREIDTPPIEIKLEIIKQG